jgi:two-component system CheB/CheR fusion protein
MKRLFRPRGTAVAQRGTDDGKPETPGKDQRADQVNNDMTNLLNSSEIATVFLDNNFHIKRFTPAATRVFNLIASDLGRPLAHIRSNLRFESVEQEVKEVIDRLTPRENEVQSNDGKYYVMRIIPYRTLDNFIDGQCSPS